MSTSVFPSIPGLTYPLKRTPMFQTRRPESISGKETRVREWAYPRYAWELEFSVLRQGTILGTYTEFATLESFFELMGGGYDSFLYTDANDNSVTTQLVGTGDGATVVFPLIRAFGSASTPVLAPNLTITPLVYLNAVLQSAANYTITPWGTANTNGPGQLIFNTAPGAGVVVTVTYSYYFPVRFDDDTMSFENFMLNLYSLKKMGFTSIK